MEEVKDLVNKMNSCSDRKTFEQYKFTLKKLLRVMKIKEEDDWKIANKYVDNNLNRLSIW